MALDMDTGMVMGMDTAKKDDHKPSFYSSKLF